MLGGPSPLPAASTGGDSERPVPVLVDTDGGIDDAAALWWLLGRRDIEVVAVTTVHGNITAAAAAGNVARVLTSAGHPEIPVAVGAEDPLGPVLALRPASFIHGRDGLGDVGLTAQAPPFAPTDEPASEALARLAARHRGLLRVVTLGPLTNLAVAMRQHPDLVDDVATLTVMGGAVAVPGNALPLGEANIAHDPTAAQEVVVAGWRDATLVGLDVTHLATFDRPLLDLVAQRLSPAASFMAGPLETYARFGGTFCASGEVPCHDLVAAMVGVTPRLVSGPRLPVAVQTGAGPAAGATVFDRRVPHFERAGQESAQADAGTAAGWCRAAIDVDVEAVRAEMRSLMGG